MEIQVLEQNSNVIVEAFKVDGGAQSLFDRIAEQARSIVPDLSTDKGRKAIAEVLILDDELREMIVQRAPISSLKERAIHCGLQPIRESALNWVARGETTLEEVIRVTG